MIREGEAQARAVPERPSDRPSEENALEPDYTPTCILLADDNADMRAYLQRLLAPRYTVVAVGDGASALAAARAQQPDLVLSDVMMSGMDGLALVATLRADPRTAAVRVLLLSSRACEQAAIDGLQAGADDYLIKPFSARELLARVRAHVTIAQARRREAERERHYARHLQIEHSAKELERHRLQLVLDLLPAGVVFIDAAGAPQRANRAARRILGVDLNGRPHPMADPDTVDPYGVRRLDGSPIPAHDLPIQRSLLRGEEVRGEQLLLWNSEENRDIAVLVNSAPLRTAGGDGAVMVFQDISPIRDLERQRDEFLATITHDLKNPLTSMMGISELLQHRVEHQAELDREGMVRALNTLISTAQRMVGQVDELLDTTRLQMCRSLDLDPQPTDLVAMAQRLVVEYGRNGDLHTVRLDTAEQVLEGLYDRLRLERALSNLLDNAIKYSPRGGAITLSLIRSQEDTGTWVTISVSDQGLGIPEADLPRISERFFRASNVVGHARGSGLGLAGVRQIAEGHGGSIAITSTEGAGTTVSLRLPHRAIPCDEGSIPREPEGPNGL